MNIQMTDTGIRKATGLDFAYIRKLPVQLTCPSAESLLLKQLRLMMQASDYELSVLEREKRIAAFMALQYVPARDSAMRFLLIKYLALDRFALARGSAAEMEEHATDLAATAGCPAVLVRDAALSSIAFKFYKERGYVQEGGVLIKRNKSVINKEF